MALKMWPLRVGYLLLCLLVLQLVFAPVGSARRKVATQAAVALGRGGTSQAVSRYFAEASTQVRR